MLYDLVFHWNLDFGISNQLCIVNIITLFHFLKALSPFHLITYIQALSTNFWLADPQYFPLTIQSQWK
jgi:hypothetical protein